jgi:phage-related protein (TIGR01555 family)
VYAAERTANEAPMLAMTKRTDVIKTDAAQALANQGEFERYMDIYVRNRDNYGVKIIDNNDDMVRLDTSLAELDSVIMTQFQLVSAASYVPSTKLMGTSPKGFQSKGEYEISNYHEFLESLQETGMTALVERHHAIVMRSDIMPKFGLKEPLETCIHWNKLDAMTEEQQAEVNKKKAETGKALVDAGAIDGMDERKRIISDPTSGYNGLIDEEMPEEVSDVESEGGELEDA